MNDTTVPPGGGAAKRSGAGGRTHRQAPAHNEAHGTTTTAPNDATTHPHTNRNNRTRGGAGAIAEANGRENRGSPARPTAGHPRANRPPPKPGGADPPPRPGTHAGRAGTTPGAKRSEAEGKDEAKTDNSTTGAHRTYTFTISTHLRYNGKRGRATEALPLLLYLKGYHPPSSA